MWRSNLATSPSPDQPPVLYKVHTAWESGGASSGDVHYYEGERGRARMIEDLLEHHLDIAGNYKGRTNSDRSWRLSDLWLRWLRKGEEPKRRTTKVFSVQRFTETGWVPVEVEFVVPKVHIKDPVEAQG